VAADREGLREWSAPGPYSLYVVSNFHECRFRLRLTSLLDISSSAAKQECHHEDDYGCTGREKGKYGDDVVLRPRHLEIEVILNDRSLLALKCKMISV
jgi:hypothetical protein